ncbi:sialate O-acetylesterase [Winogradskyella sp. SYSU M77433]|uniref:sialate O-acetylesterase n=1 Tax=Winogradskyella sp. SYSU M77433 TaxID=3042722 RepID=UPI00247FFB83|nr:sialate O-acetylesterase [Winogradskyella sp. SYSU M77433]MDH7911721.1 sialate O-acetylesterase [Winogradskyella sp. SYSU M77433]
MKERLRIITLQKRILQLTFCLFVIFSSSGQVKLPTIFQDGMVLQRHTNIKVWGWASPGEKVRVKFNGKSKTTKTSRDGSWSIELPKMKAGGPFTLKVSGTNEIILNDVLIGDVWLCSGQSNMVHQLDIHDVTYADEIKNVNYSEIRHFKIPTNTDLNGPIKDLDGGKWQKAIGEEVRPFSAVAYFFAKKIYEKYNVPIGLINASVGGTPIEAWISEDGYKNFPKFLEVIERNKDTSYVNSLNGNHNNTISSPLSKDKGLIRETPWYSLDFEPKNWRRINIPGYWEDQGVRDLNGVVWYRREIQLPQSMTGEEAEVFLGRIVNADELYINGKKIAQTTYQYPQRRYNVPKDVLKEGENLFVIRVTNYGGKGGFVPDKPYKIFNERDTVDLKGYWEYKVGEVFPPRDRSSFAGPRRINPQNEPTALYNAMVAPYLEYPITGVLWYQGESNAGRPEEYAELLPALIKDWRAKFTNVELPFIYAQLPNFGDVDYLPTESGWAKLRESQLKSLVVPNTAMTVNIELGEWNDIHPDNKKDVGERMALAAQKLAYKEDIVHSGPLYKSHIIQKDKVIISFLNIGGGLITDDGEELSEFAIAGEDGEYVWANAKIVDNKVVVWSDTVPHPKYVKYAWSDNPDNPNLYNKEGLPASPFRIE